MKLRALPLLITSLIATALTVSATPLSSEVTSVSTVTPGSTLTGSDSWSGTPEDLYSSATNGSSNGVVISQAMTFNSAADGNSGTTFFYTQWNLSPGNTYAANEGTSWAYSFVADATGNFVMDYSGSLTGSNTFGMHGFNLTGDLGSHHFNPHATDQFVAAVIQGFTYSINLSINANISGDLGERNSIMYGSFRWTAPRAALVPDAANTIGLMMLSLTGLLAMRRKLVRS